MLKKAMLVLTVLLLSFVLVPETNIPFKLAPANPMIEMESQVIRFHVLAHSDDPEEQKLKNKVRDVVMEYIRGKIDVRATLEEVRSLLQQEKERVKEITSDFLGREGVFHPVQVFYGEATFPTRLYRDKVYPAGTYETFQVVLGEGKGENWWCVMFPPLCLVDLAMVPPAELGEEDRSGAAGEAAAAAPLPGGKTTGKSNKIPLRFKFLEFLHKIFHKSN